MFFYENLFLWIIFFVILDRQKETWSQVSFRFEGDLYHSNDAETIEHA